MEFFYLLFCTVGLHLLSLHKNNKNGEWNGRKPLPKNNVVFVNMSLGLPPLEKREYEHRGPNVSRQSYIWSKKLLKNVLNKKYT